MGDSRRLTQLDFDEWVAHVFDHPGEGPIWYHDMESPYWGGPAATTIEYTTRLFETPRAWLDPFTDAQLGRSFWYLIGGSGNNYMEALGDPAVPLDARVRCMRSFVTLFRELFAARCVDQLGHLDREGEYPLNTICYMWWDTITFYPQPDATERRSIDMAALTAMEDILSIDTTCCRESALHGLGHWNRAYPSEVARIIDGFLENATGMADALIAYARAARSGCVL
jgi:hypothetical protein